MSLIHPCDVKMVARGRAFTADFASGYESPLVCPSAENPLSAFFEARRQGRGIQMEHTRGRFPLDVTDADV